MSQPVLIAPSILSADFTCLGAQIQQAEAAGADWIHVDVMDGHFVPNLTLGPLVAAACRRATRLPLDVHLMVSNPDSLLPAFAQAGADYLTVHVETCPHLHRTLQSIRELGCRPGVVLNPATPAAAILPVLHLVDLVLVMSVNPGFGGQAFIPQVLPKTAELRAAIQAEGRPIWLEMDGGINAETLPQAQAAGVDVFVAGNAIFAHPAGIAAGIQSLRQAARA